MTPLVIAWLTMKNIVGDKSPIRCTCHKNHTKPIMLIGYFNQSRCYICLVVLVTIFQVEWFDFNSLWTLKSQNEEDQCKWKWRWQVVKHLHCLLSPATYKIASDPLLQEGSMPGWEWEGAGGCRASPVWGVMPSYHGDCLLNNRASASFTVGD